MILYEIFDGDHRTYYKDEISALRVADLKAKITDYGMNGFIFVDKLTVGLEGKKLVCAILNSDQPDGSNWIEERERVYERLQPNA
jgi:hypothetical protein